MQTTSALSGAAKFKQAFMKYGIYALFVVLIVFFSFTNSSFLTLNNFLLILQQLSPFGIAAIGMIFVMVTGGIDISVGRVMFISCVITGEVIMRLPPSIMESPALYPLCFAIVIVISAVFGLANAFLVVKLRMFPFIATLISGYIARGIGLSIAGITKYDVSSLSPLANGKLGSTGIPYAFIIFIILAVIMNFVLRRTRYGRFLMAIGNNRHAAEQIGINVEKYTVIAYVICAVCAGIGGLMSAAQISEVFTTFGENNEFQIISAAVIGGTSLFGGKGSILPGAIIGVLLIQIVLNGLSMMNASIYVFNIVRGIIIFLAVMLDSIDNKGELR